MRIAVLTSVMMFAVIAFAADSARLSAMAEQKREMQRKPRVVKSEVEAGSVKHTFSDGSTTNVPINYVVQPQAARDAVELRLAERELAAAVLKESGSETGSAKQQAAALRAAANEHKNKRSKNAAH